MTSPRDAALTWRGDDSSRQDAMQGVAGDPKADSRLVGLATRLDEGAREVRQVTVAKMGLSLLGALMAGLTVNATTAAGWTAGALILSAWTWVLTRPQARGGAVGWVRRAGFVCGLAAETLWWLLLGALLWSSGSVGGQASALMVFCGIGVTSVLLFYNTPIVFLAAGACPTMAALTLVVLRGGLGWREVAPIWIGLALSLIFNLGRALETPSQQAAQRRLNDSLNRYRILAENVTDVIMRADLDGRFQYVSPASLAVLGYRPEELVGTLRQDYLAPTDAELMDAMLERMLASPERTDAVSLQVNRKDGRPIWLQTTAKLVYEQGVAVAVISASRDITAQVATDIALQEAKLEAEAANLAKAEFLANVSHEIRTPMNGVLGALHLLEREPISAEGRELMRQASDCGRLLSQLLNDVLDFSKIEAGQLDLAPEPMDAVAALEAVTALLRGQAAAKGVELACETAGEPIWIDADPARLRQVMFNLVGNAVKFTFEGRVAARLGAGAVDDAGRRRVSLEVQDTGIGMSAQAQQRIFERFRQAESDTVRRFGGTGLGLAISQELARAMGGEISCESVEGEGSTFRLAFDAPAVVPAVAPTTEELLLEGVSILLVEDNATNRLVARTILTRVGATVAEADDGVAGLKAARGGAYDLILMDVQMPQMNGIDATRAIRRLPGAASRTPIIGLTANAMAHQQTEYIAAGMDGVVAKPIAPAALLAEIGRLLAGEARLAS
jgi:PAS domain S-box-containing protein